MKLVNAAGTEFVARKAKQTELPKWSKTEGLVPLEMTIDGNPVKVFSLPEKSDYAYFDLNGTIMVFHAKDEASKAVLKETALLTPPPVEKPVKEKKASKASAAPAEGEVEGTNFKKPKGGGKGQAAAETA